ncbi:MAG TPA: DinB family protein [Bacteroidia bacterium]|nr:DinB family protein [Bacteroidia bacterium]
MNQRVAKLFSRLQNKHTELLEELDKVAPEILETSPGKNKWSVTQVMFHLDSAESNSVLYVSKKRLGAARLNPTGFESQLRLIIAIVAFYLPVKYRAPKVLGAMPERVRYSEIKNTWIETRTKLFSLLESLPEDELRKPVFRQPFFGYWNIFQMLWFMQIHFNRHRLQMHRAIKKLKS